MIQFNSRDTEIFFVSDYIQNFTVAKKKQQRGRQKMLLSSEKLKDYENYVIEQITDETTVEKIVYSQFSWLYAKSGLKSMLEFISVEFAKYKNNDGNRFEDWIQEYRVLMLDLLTEYRNCSLSDLVNELTKSQCIHFKELETAGIENKVLAFKILTWWACGMLREKIRGNNVTRTLKYQHCSNDLFIETNVKYLFSIMTDKEKSFILSCKKKYHLTENQTEFVIICFNCSEINCYDFSTRLAEALNVSSRNIRKIRKNIRTRYEKYRK